MRPITGLASALIGLFGVMRALKLSNTENQKPQNRDENQRPANSQSDEAIRLLAAELVGIRAEIRDHKAQEKRTKEERLLDWGTFVVLVAGTGVAIATLWRLDDSIDLARRQMQQTEAFTRMTLDQQSMLADQQLKVANDALAIAQDANRLSERATREQISTGREETRARITILPLEWNTSSPPRTVNFRLRFQNNGKTTAESYRQVAAVRIAPADQAFVPSFPKLDEFLGGPLEAEQISFLPLSLPLPNDVYEGLKKGTHVAYFFGSFAYRDVFGVDHRRRFCKAFNAMTSLITSCSGDEQKD